MGVSIGILAARTLFVASAQVMPMQGSVCTDVRRPDVERVWDHALSRAELAPLIDPLSTVQVVYMDDGKPVPDPVGDAMRARLDTMARKEPAFFRQALATIIAKGLEGEYATLVTNNAAVRYRWEWGEADPLLAMLQGVPGDRFLFPLSALTGPLPRESEEFVFRVVCEVARPLIALRREMSDSSYREVARKLEWHSVSERIVRHGERLLQGHRASDMRRLIRLIAPLAPVLSESSFRRRPGPG